MREPLMKPTVYLETTVVSYLTAWPSPDKRVAGHQETTKEWWATEAAKYRLVVSDAVIQEASGGDPTAAAELMTALDGIEVLPTSGEALALASALIKAGALPAKAVLDATHLGIAAANGVHFLLTWNCRHLANAVQRTTIETVCLGLGYQAPIICTPEELVEGTDYVA